MLEDHGEYGEEDCGEGEDIGGVGSLAGSRGARYGVGALRWGKGCDESVSGSYIGGGAGRGRFRSCSTALCRWCLRKWECKAGVNRLGLGDTA